MASPLPASQSQTQPLTPPAEPSSQNAATSSQTLPNTQTTGTSSNNNNVSSSQATAATPAVPPTSLQDTGLSKRPRDARLIHLILASMGVSAYQERVPLQLLDFAYRYTSGVLTDALHIQSEGYDTADAGGGGKGRGRGAGAAGKDGAAAAAAGGTDNVADPGGVSLTSLRMAIGGRSQYQFHQGLPKEFLLDLASKRNTVGLPGSIRGGTRIGSAEDGVSVAGMRLPHERYCLSGTGWGLRDQWDSEGEEEDEEEGERVGVNGEGNKLGGGGGEANGDVGMGGMDGAGDGEEDEDLEGDAEREGLEDLFGGGGKVEQDEDQEMGEG